MKYSQTIYCIVFYLLLALAASHAYSNADTSTNMTPVGNYEINYTTFPSTLILPEVAEIYGIKRSRHEVLLNLSVNIKDKIGGLAVKPKGKIRNLLQQEKALKFKTIAEDGVTYYLAPIRVTKKEVIHFFIELTLPNAEEPELIKFTKTLYADT